jgi:hypothetical protein
MGEKQLKKRATRTEIKVSIELKNLFGNSVSKSEKSWANNLSGGSPLENGSVAELSILTVLPIAAELCQKSFFWSNRGRIRPMFEKHYLATDHPKFDAAACLEKHTTKLAK